MNRAIGLTLISSLLALSGCFSNHGEPEPTFDVDVAIAAVALADDCGAAAASRFAGDCAPPEEPSDPADEPTGVSSEDGCGGFCQESSVSLAITADADRALSFAIQRVILLDADERELMDLSPGNARLYDAAEGYLPWDEMIPTPSSELSVIYELSGLDWSGIEDSYGRTFKLRVVIDIEGDVRTLTSEEVTREYAIVT